MLLPGNTASLWKAVKIAKDVNTDTRPGKMHHSNVPIAGVVLPDSLAAFFNKKILDIAKDVPVKDGVYNGTKKINSENKMFMDAVSIKECIMTIKISICL